MPWRQGRPLGITPNRIIRSPRPPLALPRGPGLGAPSRQYRAVLSRAGPAVFYLVPVGLSRWRITLKGTVHASADPVVQWWFDPERLTEYLSGAEQRGALDLSRSDSVEDGVRIRTLRYRTVQGWDFDRRFESVSSKPVRSGDRYRSESQDVLVARRGKRSYEVRCSAVLEFREKGLQETQILQTHVHTMTGGSWRQKISRQINDREVFGRSFYDSVRRCESAQHPGAWFVDPSAT